MWTHAAVCIVFHSLLISCDSYVVNFCLKTLPSFLNTAAPVSSKPAAQMSPTSAESASGVSSAVANDNDSVGVTKPTKVLSSLVAYGDDSDSDVDN